MLNYVLGCLLTKF